MPQFIEHKTLAYFLLGSDQGITTNVFFLWNTFIMPLKSIDIHLLLPAQILFLVSGYRCLFPVNYTTSAVLHDSFFSSIFFTRFLATFAEVGYIYLFSHLIRLLNAEQIQMIDFISWLMVLQVIISQFFVFISMGFRLGVLSCFLNIFCECV